MQLMILKIFICYIAMKVAIFAPLLVLWILNMLNKKDMNVVDSIKEVKDHFQNLITESNVSGDSESAFVYSKMLAELISTEYEIKNQKNSCNR